MTASFSLRFLGAVQLDLDGAPLRGLRSRKAVALLGYLAAYGESVSRAQLATLFWPEFSESRALGNLSWAVAHLNGRIQGCLSTDRYTVRLQETEHIKIDLITFRELVARRAPEALAAAVELYRGEFMQGFYLNGCPEFETWLLCERERWHQQAIQALETLILYERNRGAYRQAVPYATRLLQIDPCREEAHRYLMSLLAIEGQRAAALAQYETCCRVLQEELDVEPSEETKALYEQIRAGRIIASQPEPATSQVAYSSTWYHLPTPCTPFIGREQELAQLAAYLANPAYRIITILGLGGIGKTRLALQVAEQQHATFRNGVCVVPLMPVVSSDGLMFAIAEALGLSFADNADPKVQLQKTLSNKELLLVLDNFEHLLDGSVLLLELLHNIPQLKLLVTSRERLHLQAEYPFILEGLYVPSEATEENVTSASAVQLFMDRACRSNPAFELRAEYVRSIIQICRLMEGNPLGIELAAAWVDRLPPASIAEGIQANMDILATTMRDVPDRHRSIRAVFEGSWGRLSQSEQQAISRLSVFQGSFGRDAALAVTEATLAELVSLEHKSLVRRTGSGRYELHELVRYYAREKLGVLVGDLTPGVVGVRDRHSTFYLGCIARAEPALNGPNPQQAMAELRLDLDDIRQAWYWAVKYAKLSEIEGSLKGLVRFYNLTCLFREADMMFSQAAERIEVLLEGTDTPQPTLEILLGKLRAEQSGFLTRQAYCDRAIEIARSVLILAQRHQAVELEATISYYLAEAFTRQGEADLAQAHAERALVLAQHNRIRWLEARNLYLIGRILSQRGDYNEARSSLERAWDIYQEIGDRAGEGSTLGQLGNISWYKGDFATAKTHYELCLHIAQETGNLRAISIASHNLADTLWPLGEYERARQIFEQELRLFQELSDNWGVNLTLMNLGNIFLLLGDYGLAENYSRQALRLAREISNQWAESQALVQLGQLAHLRGDNRAAYECSEQGLVIAQSFAGRSEQAQALACMGYALVGLEQWVEAQDRYQQALSIWYAAGQYHKANEALAGLAACALAQDDTARAQEYVETILRHMARGMFAGTLQPFRIYEICIEVLYAIEDPRAQELQNQVYAQLEEQAAKISDPTSRRLFVEHLPRAVSQ
jgi:predicted ATPase/DNA-binding SARP family transcriptional activator